ncbi:hypothetical protein [Candidatus Binatus sp.]|uniref:hypothetical protein n=1 Tax=Candidatus Binatus sp. TaxID=2811406 RepID=UPI003CC66EC6
MRKQLTWRKNVDNERMPGAKQPSEDNRVWTALKQYLTTIHHRWRFVVALIVIFALGAFLVFMSRSVIGPDDEPWQGLAAGLGDAFIIAVVVALLVDPVAQHQFATEWGRDLYWAIFSPQAPQAFRDALGNLAAPDAYIDKCTHLFELSRADEAPDVLTIDWQISIYGHALRRGRPLPWDGQVFVVRRHDGRPSVYTYWSFQVEGSDKVEFNEMQLKNLAVENKRSGRCVLDQSQLRDVPPIPFGKPFWSNRHVVTTRKTNDFLTLFQPKIVLNQRIIVRGEAASKFDFYVTQLGGSVGEAGEIKLKHETLQGGLEQQSCDLDAVAFPGQTTMVFWREKPRDEAPAQPPAPL